MTSLHTEIYILVLQVIFLSGFYDLKFCYFIFLGFAKQRDPVSITADYVEANGRLLLSSILIQHFTFFMFTCVT